ncbi:hypothetical protein Tco_0334942 [Tanacetum coccineum]
MSSDNASSAVTYTSVSSDSNGPSSWGIPLVNAGEIPEMDPYEEVAQQGQAHPLSPAYVPDPMELDEHVPVYVPGSPVPRTHQRRTCRSRISLMLRTLIHMDSWLTQIRWRMILMAFRLNNPDEA